MPDNVTLNRTQLRHRNRDSRREELAATVVEATTVAPALSHQAAVMQRVFPRDLIEQQKIQPQTGGANRGYFAPELFTRNPQHGRVVQRIVEQLTRSLDANGQQEPVVARLITDADRQQWSAITTERRFLLIDGHQRHAAIAGSSHDRLWAEIVLPLEGEDDTAYRRRCLTLASIKMMQSQAYDIFDKVNQVRIWMEEFGERQLPTKQKLADTFHISPTEAQRIRTVTRLAPAVADRIKQAENKPADEVIAIIAGFPPEEQEAAFTRFGNLPVSQVRVLLKQEKNERPAGTGGRPQNYVYRVNDPQSDIVAITTRLTPQQWKAKGGVSHFWESVQAIGHSREHQDRLKSDLD